MRPPRWAIREFRKYPWTDATGAGHGDATERPRHINSQSGSLSGSWGTTAKRAPTASQRPLLGFVMAIAPAPVEGCALGFGQIRPAAAQTREN